MAFAAGSACLLLGPFRGYADLVGATAVAVTFVVGSLFFTTGGALQPGWPLRSDVTPVPDIRRGGPRRRRNGLPIRGAPGWWQPAVNLVGCILFGSSAIVGYVVAATGSFLDLAAANWTTAARDAAWLVRTKCVGISPPCHPSRVMWRHRPRTHTRPIPCARIVGQARRGLRQSASRGIGEAGGPHVRYRRGATRASRSDQLRAVRSQHPGWTSSRAPNASGAGGAVRPADPLAVLRSRRYLGLLVLTALLGVPLSAIAYGFLKLSELLQSWMYKDLPSGLGFSSPPTWWPLPVLAVGGLLVAVIIRYWPGGGGESPVDGFKPGGTAAGPAIPGIALAALATLGCGAVLGPEAPLVALGGALAALAVRSAKRDAPAQVIAIVGATGSFAAIGTLLGSPLAGAFLLMEAAGLAGSMLELVLIPGLLASAVGALIFVGLDSWTGFGTFSLTVPQLPGAQSPDVAQFGWAFGIGVAAALLGWGLRKAAVILRSPVSRHRLLLTPIVAVAIAGLAVAYTEATGKATSDVLFSGQSTMPALIDHSAQYSVGTLLMLLLCKSLAYSASLASFRGGPTFPAMFAGSVGGVALSHLPGLPLVTAVAMGIAAMTTAILRLPLTAVLLTTLFLLPDALTVMPVEVVAVVVAYVVVIRLPDPTAPRGPTRPATTTRIVTQPASPEASASPST